VEKGYCNQYAMLCYTDNMQPDHFLWQRWAHLLQRWGLQNVASFLLEAGGPINVLAAEMIYLGQPFLGRAVPISQLQALADLFEDRDQARQFAAFLREEI
jgi:hypothetical protein